MTLKFGRRPPRPTMRTVRSAFIMEQHLNDLGPAPAASNDYVAAVDGYTGGNWTMMGNDQVGDCTCADSGHSLMLRTANGAAGSAGIVIASTESIVALYGAITGYNGDPATDQGADENQVCQYMESTGLLQHKSDAFGSVDPQNLDHVKWCTQLFGTCRLGFTVPQSAMDQFSAGQPWDVIGDPATNFVGGHDVPVVKYDGQYFYVVTWGKLQPMTPKFLLAYTEEAHAELYADWITSQGTGIGTGLSFAQLAGDLIAVR